MLTLATLGGHGEHSATFQGAQSIPTEPADGRGRWGTQRCYPLYAAQHRFRGTFPSPGYLPYFLVENGLLQVPEKLTVELS